MRHPAQALLWEQWRQTWKVIPFSLAMIMIILWFLPQYFMEYKVERWSMEVGLIICSILGGIFCIAIQGEGGARGGTIANRHYVLPVSSLLIAAVPVFVFSLILLGTLVIATAFVAVYEQTPIRSLLEPTLLHRNLLFSGCFVLAYGLTIGTSSYAPLRILLTLLVLLLLVLIAQTPSLVVPSAAIAAFALVISIPVAAYIVKRGRHRSAPPRGTAASVLSPVATLADRLQKVSMRIPSNMDAALLWQDLRGGKKLLLPAVIALPGILIFLAVCGVVIWGYEILTRLRVPRVVSELWPPIIFLIGTGLFIYGIARLGPRLAGGSKLFAPWSPETSFWKRQPVAGPVLATVKLKSVMLQCVCWSICLCVVVAIIPIVFEILNHSFLKVLRDGSGYLRENGVLRWLAQLVARPVLITALALWTFSALAAAIALTGRRSFYSFALATLAFAALAVLRLVSLPSSWEYYDAVEPLKSVVGIIIILFSIVPLVWSIVRSYADKFTLLLLAGGCLIAEMVIFNAYPRVTFPGVLELSFYAIPYAPLGLLPIAVRWGRRL